MAADDRPDIFSQLPLASWTVRGDTISFPVDTIEEDGGNRIVRRRRPYRDGAKLDDTGSNEVVWTITATFENTIEEDGLQTNTPLYPGILNAILFTVGLHDTGTLVLPTRGAIRCRLESYKRRESPEERDSATVTFVFVQDNEDNVDAASFERPSLRGTVQTIVNETTFGMEGLGGFAQMLADLEDAASNLQDAIAAPGEAIQDVDQKASRVVRIATNVEDQFTRSAQLGRDLLTDPDSWATVRNLRILRERTATAVQEKTSGIAPMVTALVATGQSLFDLAATIGQDPMDLASINTQLDSLLYIPAGTVINIFSKDR